MGIRGPLYLTPVKCPTPIRVPAKYTESLQTFHISNIRFIYENYVKGQHVLLNNVSDMNEARSVAAFLQAVKDKKSSLVICKDINLFKWYYELTKTANLKTSVVRELGADHATDFSNTEVVLLPNTCLRVLNQLNILEFFLLVVEDIDLLYNSRYLKKIECEFKIGITAINFLIDPNTKLFWDIQRWSNKDLVEDYENFVRSIKISKRNFQKFYPNFWQRLTWDELANLKPNYIQTQEYQETVLEWAIENNLKMETKFVKNLQRTRNKPAEHKTKKLIEKKTKTRKPRDVILKTLYMKGRKRSATVSENSNITEVKVESVESSITEETIEETVEYNVKNEESGHSVYDILLGKTSRDQSNSAIQEIETVTVKCEFKEENPILDSLFCDTMQDNIVLDKTSSGAESDDDNTECILDSLLK